MGVIDADLGLQGGDLRAAEKTFQLIRQVAGRPGGRIKRVLRLCRRTSRIIRVIKAILSGEEEAFWKAEAEQRRVAGVPPYGRMAGVVGVGA